MSKFFVKATNQQSAASNTSKDSGVNSVPSSNADLERNTSVNPESGIPIHSKRQKHLPIQRQRELLPIYRYKTNILYLLEKYQTLVIVGGNSSFHQLSWFLVLSFALCAFSSVQ
jgi:HrpA-like RNA helicase